MKVTRTEARLEALRGIGVDVSRWLEKAQEKSQGERLSTSDLSGEWALANGSQNSRKH